MRALAIALVAIVSFGLFGLGVLLSETYGAAQVARNASELHRVNETLGAAGITRAAVAQAVFFSFGDVSSAEGKARAITEAESNLGGLAELVADERAPTDVEGLTAFVSAAEATVSLARAGESGEAEAVRLTDVESAFTALEADLVERQQSLEAAVGDSDAISGRIARITFVAIAFVIPAITMVVFWILLRRRVRAREQLMQAHLEAERELSRAKDEPLMAPAPLRRIWKSAFRRRPRPPRRPRPRRRSPRPRPPRLGQRPRVRSRRRPLPSLRRRSLPRQSLRIRPPRQPMGRQRPRPWSARHHQRLRKVRPDRPPVRERNRWMPSPPSSSSVPPPSSPWDSRALVTCAPRRG